VKRDGGFATAGKAKKISLKKITTRPKYGLVGIDNAIALRAKRAQLTDTIAKISIIICQKKSRY